MLALLSQDVGVKARGDNKIAKVLDPGKSGIILPTSLVDPRVGKRRLGKGGSSHPVTVVKRTNKSVAVAIHYWIWVICSTRTFRHRVAAGA